MSNVRTMYLVRDAANRKYLNRPVYTGRAVDAWGRIGESHLFWNRSGAEACARDINRRAPGSKVATVVTCRVDMA